MLTVYLFCLFILVYAYLFTSPRNPAIIPTVAAAITEPETVRAQAMPIAPLPALVVTPDPVELAPVAVANLDPDQSGGNAVLPDLNGLTARQLHRLCRQLRQDQGITIKGYKALPVSELRSAIWEACSH